MKTSLYLLTALGFVLIGLFSFNFWLDHPEGSVNGVLLNASLIFGIFFLLAAPAPFFAACVEFIRGFHIDTIRNQVSKVATRPQRSSKRNTVAPIEGFLAHN